MGDYLDASAAGTNATMDAASARANGRIARNQAYASAYKLENDADASLALTGDNLMRMQRNKTAALSAQRAEQFNSGFTHSGSKLATEKSLAEILDLAIDDQMRSASAAASSAYTQANLNRHLGDSQQRMANIQSQFNLGLASSYNTLSRYALVSDAFKLAGQFAGIFGSAPGSAPSSAPKSTT